MHYYYQIHRVFSNMYAAAQRVLPTNRAIVDNFLGCYALTEVDRMLCGVHDILDTSYSDFTLYEEFSGYVDKEQARMKRTLSKISYNIDAPNALSLITGKGQLDKASGSIEPEKCISRVAVPLPISLSHAGAMSCHHPAGG